MSWVSLKKLVQLDLFIVPFSVVAVYYHVFEWNHKHALLILSQGSEFHHQCSLGGGEHACLPKIEHGLVTCGIPHGSEYGTSYFVCV